MRLALDLIYCPTERYKFRTDYTIKVCKTLNQAFDVARDYLQLAHKNQTNNYYCPTRGKHSKQ